MCACTFFGHRECYGLDRMALRRAIAELIDRGVEQFYVGNQGGYDGAVYGCLKELQKQYPHICVSIVLAYLPTKKREGEDLSDTLYPEIEGHPQFAIERRNKWMLAHSDYCICYVNHTWGGAYKFARLAKQKGLALINLGTVAVDTI